MIIHKDSWHYKLRNMFTYVKQNETLCEYFWKTVFSIAFLIFFIFLGVFCAFVLLNAVATLVLGLFGIFYPLSLLGYCSIFVGSVVSISVGIIEWLSGNINVFPEYMKKPFIKLANNGGKPNSKPNLFTERYKAYKDKVCPIVEFKED